MVSIELRDLHLVKKALAITLLMLGRQSGPLSSPSDQFDMKLLLERLTDTAELEFYMHSAQMAVADGFPRNEE